MLVQGKYLVKIDSLGVILCRVFLESDPAPNEHTHIRTNKMIFLLS